MDTDVLEEHATFILSVDDETSVSAQKTIQRHNLENEDSPRESLKPPIMNFSFAIPPSL
jgi:hypothetical protein